MRLEPRGGPNGAAPSFEARPSGARQDEGGVRPYVFAGVSVPRSIAAVAIAE